jgi:hypothetical protein
LILTHGSIFEDERPIDTLLIAGTPDTKSHGRYVLTDSNFNAAFGPGNSIFQPDFARKRTSADARKPIWSDAKRPRASNQG